MNTPTSRTLFVKPFGEMTKEEQAQFRAAIRGEDGLTATVGDDCDEDEMLFWEQFTPFELMEVGNDQLPAFAINTQGFTRADIILRAAQVFTVRKSITEEAGGDA